MAGMTVEEFEAYVLFACSNSSIVESAMVTQLGEAWSKVRMYLIDGSFAEASYNEETGKTTFAHIRDNQRVFGADNRRGWHWHPVEDPEAHIPSPAEITFEEFLQKLEANLK